MGAESHVDNSIKDPYPFVYSNVVGTVNMLEFAKDLYFNHGECTKFIYVSTDEVYGPAGKNLHIENDPHKPSNPYSASKAAGEDFCYAYYNTYGLPIIITRTMNNFGERQDAEKFVPKVVKSILQGNKINIHCKMDEKGGIKEISSRC
jgi:dTDP-glucose 4,6-dehydratase